MTEADRTGTCSQAQPVLQNLCHQCPLRSLQEVDGMLGFRCCKCDTNYFTLSDTEKKKKKSLGSRWLQHLSTTCICCLIRFHFVP